MTSKNNQNERLRKMSMENKRDRFSIRKLVVGAASVLLGFSFMAASGQIAEADSVDPNGQETSTKSNTQTPESENATTTAQDKDTATTAASNKKSKTDVTTYAGLHNFLRGGSEETEQTEGQVSSAPSSAETENTNQEQSSGSEQTQPASAEDLANAATDLQTEIGKGHDFVATPAYHQATADRQQAVTDAITQGQTTLDKYNHFVSTNDEASRVSLFDLTDAKTTIGAMITAATNTVDTQSLIPLTDSGNVYGGWTLQYSSTTKTLVISKKDSSDGINDPNTTLYDYLYSRIGTSGFAGPDDIKYIEFSSQDESHDLTINESVSTRNFVQIPNVPAFALPSDATETSPGVVTVSANSKITLPEGTIMGGPGGLTATLPDHTTTIVLPPSTIMSGPNGLIATLSSGSITFPSDSVIYGEYGLLGGFKNLKEISGLNHVKHDASLGSYGFAYLFAEDSALEKLDFTDFTADGIKNFEGMFRNDSKLKEIKGISSFGTQNAEDMSNMFYNNSSLKELDLSSFSTELAPNDANMSSMFDSDRSLEKITFGNRFVTSHVTKMGSMFNNDGALTEINGLTNFDTFNVHNMSNMFAGTGVIDSLNLNFNTLHIDDMSDVTSGPTGMFGMFKGSGVKKITFGSNFHNNPYLKNVSFMFQGTSNLTSIEGLNNLDTSHVSDMSSMFQDTSKLKKLDLTQISFQNVSSMTNMLNNAGDEDRFVLILGPTVKLKTSSTDYSGLGEYTSNSGFRGYIRELGGGTISDPAGREYLPDITFNTGFQSNLEDHYNGSGPEGTYVILTQGPDNETFIPSKLTLTVHTDQHKIASLESELNSLVFTETDPNTLVPKQYTGAQLKNLDDLLLQSNKTVTGINWVPNKALPTGSGSDYTLDEATATAPSIVTDSNGTLNNSAVIVSTPLQGLVKVVFGDGSSTYVRVIFNVKAAAPKTSAQAFNSSTDTIALDKRFDTNSVPGSYISLAGVPETDGVYFTIKDHSTSGEFKPLWNSSKVPSSSTSFTGDSPAELLADVIVHYADGGKETVGSVPIKINSMEKTSPLSFSTQQTYPAAKNENLLASMKLNAISQDKNITDLTWVDATGATNPGPTLTQVGTQSAYVKVSYTDSSYKVLPIAVQVIAQPKPGIYDNAAHPGNIEIPQYTDIGNDQQAANNAAASASVPEGTTASWGDNTLPNTNSQGDKGYHFINVTYPDGSTASIPINVSVGNAVTKDITLKHNAYIYGADGKRANGITLKAGSTVTTYGTKLINGREFYLTKDADYYLAAGNDKATERKLVQDANTYNKKGKKLNAVKHAGTTVKTYGAPILIKGKEYYSISKNRYISKDSFPPTPDTTLPGLNKGSLSTTGSRMRLKHNAYLYDEKGQRANSLILKSGSIIQTHGSIQINGKTYYAVETGEYISAKNIDENWLG